MYGLTVAVVPTHKPRIRTDHAPIVYFKCSPFLPAVLLQSLPSLSVIPSHTCPTLLEQPSRVCGSARMVRWPVGICLQQPSPGSQLHAPVDCLSKQMLAWHISRVRCGCARCRQEEMLRRLHFLLYQAQFRRRPVLIGTASVQESEWVSSHLSTGARLSSVPSPHSALLQHSCLLTYATSVEEIVSFSQ